MHAHMIVCVYQHESGLCVRVCVCMCTQPSIAHEMHTKKEQYTDMRLYGENVVYILFARLYKCERSVYFLFHMPFVHHCCCRFPGRCCRTANIQETELFLLNEN